MHPAIAGLLTIVIGVGGCIAYYYFSNQFLDKVLFPATKMGREERNSFRIRQALGFGLVLFFMLLVFLAVPMMPEVFSAIVYNKISVEMLVGGAFIYRVILSFTISVVFAFFFYVLLRNIGGDAGHNINRANMIRPWLFLMPALLALGLYLAYPVVETLRLSLTDRAAGGAFVGLDNYRQMASEPKFWEALQNNFLWLLIVPAFSTMFGLLAAQLTDKIGWGAIAKSLIFMPMAISFVGAAVIWKLVYDTRPIDQEQIGIMNAIYLSLGGAEPIQWLTIPFWNSILLMVVLIWIQTGFAMVILSAALRGIPEETVEAAIVDGAGPFQVFFKIKIPQIASTIVVVWTTITIVVLKVFDIVFAMTNGQWETQVLANYMYDKLFRANDWGVGSASAMVIMLLVSPILIWNVYNARKEMR
nr:sugar ABC transporter permease [Oceaniglobus ichthyenteri]